MTDEFEKALEENGPRFHFESTLTNPSKRIDPGFAAGARWAREWCEQKNLVRQMKDINYKVLQSNKECIEKLRTENKRLRDALERIKSFKNIEAGKFHNLPKDFKYVFPQYVIAKQALAETEGE